MHSRTSIAQLCTNPWRCRQQRDAVVFIQLGGSSSSAIETHWHDHVLLRAPQGLVTAPPSWWQTCQVRSGSIFFSISWYNALTQSDALPSRPVRRLATCRHQHQEPYSPDDIFNDNLPSVVKVHNDYSWTARFLAAW